MTSTILIGKAIYSLLKEDTDLESYVGDKIFPMIIPTDKVQYPWVIFSRTNILPRYCKDGCYEDTCTVRIIICDTDYFNSCLIAQKVREILEWKEGTEQDIIIKEIKLSGVSESTVNNVFVQTLDFTILCG